MTALDRHALCDPEGAPRRARALTIHQPWATLIARGIKRVENRDWTPSPADLTPGDYLLLHAGKTFDPDAWEGAIEIAAAEGVHVECLVEMQRPLAPLRGIANRKLRAEATRAAEARARELVPFSAVVGVARYVGVLEPGDIVAAGKRYVGPYGVALDCAVEIEPVPAQGAQGLFRLDLDTFARVRERWHEALLG